MVRFVLIQRVQQRAVSSILHARIQGGNDVLAVARVLSIGALHGLPLVAAQILHPPLAVVSAQGLVEGSFQTRSGIGALVANGALGQIAQGHQTSEALFRD